MRGFTDSQLGLLETLKEPQRGTPKASIAKAFFLCLDDQSSAALVNAAEIHYRIERDEEERDTLKLIASWPCPCEIGEHEGEVTRWRQ
jgi:hypothetical protein